MAHQQTSRFRDLVANIAGAMFFGTPHSRSDSPNLWDNTATILKYNSRIRGKDVITPDIATVLAEACRSFETAFDRIPVLSVYETQATRVSTRHVKSKGVFVSNIQHLSFSCRSKLTEIQVVGRNCCKTNVKQEYLIGLDVDHPRICNMRSDYPGVSAVASFIDRTLEAAQEQKRGDFKRRNFVASVQDILTPSRIHKFIIKFVIFIKFFMSHLVNEYPQ